MDSSFTIDLYEKLILPEFGLKDVRITPIETYDFDNDDAILLFTVDGTLYVLWWEDFGGVSEHAVKEYLGLSPGRFEFILPFAERYAPSLRFGFKAVPHTMTWYVTGSFALVKPATTVTVDELRASIPTRFVKYPERFSQHK